jgi:hypothetical protein
MTGKHAAKHAISRQTDHFLNPIKRAIEKNNFLKRYGKTKPCIPLREIKREAHG